MYFICLHIILPTTLVFLVIPNVRCVLRRILPPVFPKCFNHTLCLDNKILKEGVGADSPDLSLK